MKDTKRPASFGVRRIFKYYWPHIKKYRIIIGIYFFLYGVAVILSDIVTPIVYKGLIDVISRGATAPLASANTLYWVYILGAVVIGYSILYRLGDFFLMFSQSHLLKDIADAAFINFHAHSYRFFTENFSGSLVAKSKRFVNAFMTLQDESVFMLWFGALKLVGIFSVLVVTVPLLGASFILWCILYIVCIYFFIKKKMPLDLARAAEDSHVTAVLSDVLSNIVNIKAFAAKRREITHFQAATTKEERARRRAWNFQNMQFLVQSIFLGVLEVVGMYFVVRLWLRGEVSAGTVVLVQVYMTSIFGQLFGLGRSFAKIIQALTDADEMVDILDTDPDIPDPVHSESCRIGRGAVQFERVDFAYGGGAAVFQNFSLSIKPGEKIGIVGHSGAGKTTIVKLLLRFVDVGGGAIRIDGQDIRHITQDDLRSSIAYVPQEPGLFHRTLRENIAYGNPDATEEAVIAAAKQARAHEFIMRSPLKYETLVGERGVKLSGGERQRIAIARAILKNAPILVLDEATSSLDSESENLIREALDQLMQDKTTLVVAHRLSTVQKMDRIIVIEDGIIVEHGSHKELLLKQGHYHNFWQQQTDGFIE
ncbi:MAG: ABC transporter ATP-binding protein [Candidatus Moraniibacteriota bacterium]